MALVISVRPFSIVVPAATATTFYSAQFPMSGLNLVYANVTPNFLGGLTFAGSGIVFTCAAQTSNDGMTWSDVAPTTNLSQTNGTLTTYQTSGIIGGVFARLKFVINNGSTGVAGVLEILFDVSTGIA